MKIVFYLGKYIKAGQIEQDTESLELPGSVLRVLHGIAEVNVEDQSYILQNEIRVEVKDGSFLPVICEMSVEEAERFRDTLTKRIEKSKQLRDSSLHGDLIDKIVSEMNLANHEEEKEVEAD